MIPTININDLPYGGEVKQLDVFPARRSDGITYKVSPFSNEVVLFAGEPLNIGDCVYLNVDGFLYKAIATTELTSNVIGLVSIAATTGQEVSYVRSGNQTTSQTLITSQKYWLSSTIPGTLVSSPPTVSGQYVVLIGTAYDFDTIMIQLSSPNIIL